MNPRMTTLFAFLLLVLAGCGESVQPMQATLNAREMYTGTLNVLSTLVEAGVISQETAREEIEPIRKDAAEALDAMEKAALNNEQIDRKFWQEAFDEALEKLIRIRLEAEREQRLGNEVEQDE